MDVLERADTGGIEQISPNNGSSSAAKGAKKLSPSLDTSQIS